MGFKEGGILPGGRFRNVMPKLPYEKKLKIIFQGNVASKERW